MSIECRNTLIVSEEMLQIILEKYLGKDESGDSLFYFERIIPASDVSDWYVQTLNKLGMKWVGYDVCVKERRIEFYTEWSPPFHLIKKLAELYKDYVFRLEYHEPDNAILGVVTAQWLRGEVSINKQCWDEELGNGGEKKMSSKTQEISVIENKYGHVLFRMGLTHMVDVGIRHLTDENIEECFKQITANDEEAQANGVVPIMTVDFQCEIVRCAAELAKCGVWELFAYVKNHVAISN
jgi:hypothetical protein